MDGCDSRAAPDQGEEILVGAKAPANGNSVLRQDSPPVVIVGVYGESSTVEFMSDTVGGGEEELVTVGESPVDGRRAGAEFRGETAHREGFHTFCLDDAHRSVDDFRRGQGNPAISTRVLHPDRGKAGTPCLTLRVCVSLPGSARTHRVSCSCSRCVVITLRGFLGGGRTWPQRSAEPPLTQ